MKVPDGETQEVARWRRPKYVEACAHNPDPNKPTALFYVFDPEDPGAGFIRGRAFCKSWRCDGCAEHEAAVLFARLEEAFSPYESKDLVFMVLTLDSFLHELGLFKLDDVYWTLRERFEWFRKRFRRWLVRYGFEDFECRWVAVVEQHESGVPHVNVFLVAPKLAGWLQSRQLMHRSRGRSARNARLLAGMDHDRDEREVELHEMLTACGFGFSSTAEMAESKAAVLGYMSNVAKHANDTFENMHEAMQGKKGKKGKKRTGAKETRRKQQPRRRRGGKSRRRGSGARASTLGELAKKSQIPLAAPKGFRRLRSGVGFVPPRHKGDKTGSILHHQTTPDGYELVKSVVESEHPLLGEMIAIAIDIERDRAWARRAGKVEGHELDLQLVELDKTVAAINATMVPANAPQSVVDAHAKSAREAYSRRAQLRRLRLREISKVPIAEQYRERLAAAVIREQEYLERVERDELRALLERLAKGRKVLPRRVERAAELLRRHGHDDQADDLERSSVQ